MSISFHLSRLLGDDPGGSRVAEKMIPGSRRTSATCVALAQVGWDAEAAVEEPARTSRHSSTATARAGLDLRSDGVDQPCLKARALLQGQGPAPCHGRTEHKATLDTMRELEREGFEVTTRRAAERPSRLAPSSRAAAGHDRGVGDARQQRDRRDPGRGRDRRDVRKRGVIFHVDAAQATARCRSTSRRSSRPDELLGAQDLRAQGIGALYVRASRACASRRRSTAAATSAACARNAADAPDRRMARRSGSPARDGDDNERVRMLRDRLWQGLSQIESLSQRRHGAPRPAQLNVSFNFVEGESLIMAIKDVAVSSGGVHVGLLEPRTCCGRSAQRRARAQLDPLHGRRFTTAEEIDYTVDLLKRKIAKLRELSPLGKCTGRRRSRHGQWLHTEGRAPNQKEKSMAYSEKVIDHYENPATSARSRRTTRPSGRDGRRAGLRRRDEAADQGRRRRVIEDARFKTYGAARRSLVVARHRVGEGQDARRALSIKNTQIASELALPPVKIHCSILARTRSRRRSPTTRRSTVRWLAMRRRPFARRHRSSRGGLRGIEMAVTLTENAAKHVAAQLSKRGRGVAAPGCSHVGLFGLAYKIEFADEPRDEDVRFESHGSRCWSIEEPPYLEGTSSTSRARPQRGFKFNNPNVKDACAARILQRVKSCCGVDLLCCSEARNPHVRF